MSTKVAKKRLFISCPMNGRDEKAILESRKYMKKVAEAIWNQKFEVIDSYIKDAIDIPDGCRERIFRIGEAIKKMSEADYFIGVEFNYEYRGCYNELNIARDYGIPYFALPIQIVCPDLVTDCEVAVNE